MKISLIFESIGITGSLIVCISAIPQIIKTYKTRSADDLSIIYLVILMLGIMMLQAYSLYLGDFVFIFGNTLSVSSTGVLILLWFRYRKQE